MSKMKYSAIGKNAAREERQRQKSSKRAGGDASFRMEWTDTPETVQVGIDMSAPAADVPDMPAPHSQSVAYSAEPTAVSPVAASANEDVNTSNTGVYVGSVVRNVTKKESKIAGLKKQAANLDKKEKGIVAGVAAAVLMIIAVCIGVSVKPDAAQSVTAVQAVVSDVQQTVTVSGTVTSTSKSSFVAANGVIVKDVSVVLGQQVEAGQLLASFDVSGLAKELEAKEQEYTQSKATYEDSIEQAKKAAEQLPEINARIAELEAATADSGESNDFSVEDILSDFSLDKLTEMFEQLGNTITGAFDMSSMLGSGYSQEQTELIELQAQKLVLESQASNTMADVYKSLADSTLAAYEAYKAAYNEMSAGWTAKESGVVTAVNIKPGETFNDANAAEDFDINSVLSGLQGGLSIDSLLSSVNSGDLANGIVVDNYSGFVVEFDINQYDISKVSLGQTANITVAGNATPYTGKVTYISPVIGSGSSSLDISSITGSLIGGTASSLDAAVSVDAPDRSMIIGMTVSMELNTAFVSQTTAVPIEAIYIDGEDMYVYLIDNKRVKKQLLHVGISSNTMYQVVSGCNVGDSVVKNPSSALTDGCRIKVVESK